MRNLKKKRYKRTYFQNINRVTDTKNTLMVIKGEEVGWDKLGEWTDIYTLLYIQQITNKDLLFSTGNSTQYSVMAYVGKNLKADICIHLTESLCCTYQTNTTLQINYTLIKINLKKLKIQCNPHNEANWKPLSI